MGGVQILGPRHDSVFGRAREVLDTLDCAVVLAGCGVKFDPDHHTFGGGAQHSPQGSFICLMRVDRGAGSAGL